MAEDDDEVPKGLHISGLGNVEENDDDREGSARTSLDQINQFPAGSTAIGEALRELGDFNALAEAAKVASSVSLLKDQLDAWSRASLLTEQMKAHQEAKRALALRDMTDRFSALTGVSALASHFNAQQDAFTQARNLALACLPRDYLDSFTDSALIASSRLEQDIREYSTLMPQQVDMFADMRRALEASSLFELARAVNIPRIGSAIEMLGIGRIGSAIESANAAQLLGLPPIFHDEFKSVAALLSEQALASARITDVASASAFNSELAGKLEFMLARSLAAQEAVREEQRVADKDAKGEAAFDRRIAMISVIINILMFFLSIAVQLEERFTDGDADVRANTEALLEMRDAFDAMGSHLEAMKDAQQADTERQDASGAEIAGILRDIARTLSHQAEVDTKTGVGERQPSTSSE